MVIEKLSFQKRLLFFQDITLNKIYAQSYRCILKILGRVLGSVQSTEAKKFPVLFMEPCYNKCLETGFIIILEVSIPECVICSYKGYASMDIKGPEVL